ncbi:MAG TPA: hypothetical protein VIL01_11700 [Thermomicrobiales bacterium]
MQLLPHLLLATLACIALAACMDQGEVQSVATVPAPQPPESSPPATAEPPGSPVPPTVGEIIWALAIDPATAEPTESVSAFTTDALALYAAVPIASLPPQTVLAAEWSYNNTPLEAFASSVVISDLYSDGWVAFSLTRAPEESWPTGTYTVEILMNGQAVRSATVQMTAPS